MQKDINVATKPRSPERKALTAYMNNEALTREQIRLVEQHWPAVLLALKQRTGVYAW